MIVVRRCVMRMRQVERQMGIMMQPVRMRRVMHGIRRRRLVQLHVHAERAREQRVRVLVVAGGIGGHERSMTMHMRVRV